MQQHVTPRLPAAGLWMKRRLLQAAVTLVAVSTLGARLYSCLQGSLVHLRPLPFKGDHTTTTTACSWAAAVASTPVVLILLI